MIVRDYVIWVRFHDGAEREVDLSGKLDGEVFEPLKDMKVFKVDAELGTVVWANGGDIAPELICEHMKVLV